MIYVGEQRGETWRGAFVQGSARITRSGSIALQVGDMNEVR